MSAQKVSLTLVRSPIGRKPEHRATLRALGLRRRGANRIHTLNPAVQGMIKKVEFMLDVKEVSDG